MKHHVVSKMIQYWESQDAHRQWRVTEVLNYQQLTTYNNSRAGFNEQADMICWLKLT